MLAIKTMKCIKGDRIVKLDRSSLSSVLRVFITNQHDSTVTFDKEWIREPPFGRTTISIPESTELRISRDLVGRPLGEEVYVNLVEKPRGHYILKIGPARFESSKKKGYSLDEFLQKWQDLQPEAYNTWKGGVEIETTFKKMIETFGNEYADYWYDCTMDGIEPISYEQYAQDQIDRLMTDAERR